MASEIDTMRKATAFGKLTAWRGGGDPRPDTRRLLKWQDEHDSAFLDWRDTNPTANAAKFDRRMARRDAKHPENSRELYVTKARKNFPYAGDMDEPDRRQP